MKQLFFFCLLFGALFMQSQDTLLTRVKIQKDDSTLIVSSGDSTYSYSAWFVTFADTGISTISMTCKTFHRSSTAWLVDKDTSFTWNLVTLLDHNNQVYVACKPNENVLKICLGRQDPAVRRKFIFTVTGHNGTLSKEYNY